MANAGQARGTGDETRPEFHELGLRPREIHVVPDTLTKLGLVSAGIGVALVASVTRMLMTQGVVFRELADAAPQQVTALAWHRDEKSPIVQGLITVARDLAMLGEQTRPGGGAAA